MRPLDVREDFSDLLVQICKVVHAVVFVDEQKTFNIDIHSLIL